MTGETMPERAMGKLEHTHDLRLPDWGPYTKKYTGISHLPDIRSGLRFDLSVFPGYYRRQVLVPNVKWESGFHPWEAAADLSYYSVRYELEWKDRVYCDVSFTQTGEAARLVRSEFVNQTDQPQNLVLHLMAYLNFPPLRTYSDEPLFPSRVLLPEGAVWMDALDYADLEFAIPRPQDNLGYDGWLRGEVRGNGFVNGSGIGKGFGRTPGDWVRFTINIPALMPEAVLLVRYRSPEGRAEFALKGCSTQDFVFPFSSEFSLVQVELGDLPAGEASLEMVSKSQVEVELDGFAVVPKSQTNAVRFVPVQWDPIPQILEGPLPNSLVLKYADTETFYGLAWLGEPWEIRQLHTDELDRFLRYYVQEHVQKVLVGNGLGHFTNVFIRPIEVPPKQSRVLYGLVCSGSHNQVDRQLMEFSRDQDSLEISYRQGRSKAVRLEGNPQGESYRFSQERMAATVLTNVVYPVYTRRRYIRHYTPGKWWDCLYTWDSGFIGLGLLELDVERAVDCLNAYTTPPGDTQAAFLHHGSMVPVQHYLFHALWNRTQDRALLEYFYPRLRQYYRFFAGRLGSSTTRKMKSGLLKTWDYFYNSGGWDDYPPQVFVHRNHLEDTVTPVISTSHAIRIAKILQMAARALGESDDTREYQADIDTWTDALNHYAWDEDAGYFSYVRHTPEGEPAGFLRHEGGQNYNLGLDGASPYFAGVCSPEQERLVLERLASPERLWTPIGLCTVDKNAAYYRVDGYWNGAVWFPQQWFFWQALLGAGQPEMAARMAQTALEIWKNEVGASYNCFEHFIVQSGRGAGWHQFSGLSTPILWWYGAYHIPGRLNAGFDAWIKRQDFSQHNQRLEANLEIQRPCERPFTILATLSPGVDYQVTWNGKPADATPRFPGTLEINLDGHEPHGRLLVFPKASY